MLFLNIKQTKVGFTRSSKLTDLSLLIAQTGEKQIWIGLAQLSDEDKREFEAEILEGIREIYPVQRSGEIIFRFPRLFFTAKR